MTTNKSDYSLLAIFAALYIGSVFRFQTTPKYVLVATAGFAVLYIVWGMFHHLRGKTFHTRIVLEYLLVALLGLAIVSTLLV